MTRYVVEEVDGEFVLPIAGFVCSAGRGDSELILRAPNSEAESWILGSHLADDLIRQLVGRQARVERALAGSDSTLRIDFDDGVPFVNPPEREVESWEVRGPGYVLAVGVPGGREPAIWDATSEIRPVRPDVDLLPTQVAKMIEMYPGLPELRGEFEFRPTVRGTEAIELHPPDAPQMNRSELIRFVLPGRRSSSTGSPYLRFTN